MLYPKQLINQLLWLLGIASLDVPHHGKTGVAEGIDGIDGIGAVERGEGDKTGKVEIPKANGKEPLLGLTIPSNGGEIWRCAVLIVFFSMISIRYDFHPFCLLRKVMAEILVSCGIDGTKSD